MADFFRGVCPHCHGVIEAATDRQKAAFDALCRELQLRAYWPPGSQHRLSAIKWEQLLILGWLKEKQADDFEVVPAIGQGGDWEILYSRYARMTKQEGSEILAYANAFAAEQGIER